ncbi:hypothetical protein [Hufsiella ginkgonis]|uniref:Uncharacterized protein n=1 Tax=Hufsiella ginkgonis TaxID=2695274 RepID=A0A7K1XVJ0_9SPHI|nr:hypothetical protein [Hufsiella ginkgonis]MXV15013.1 hypothetical protein [Hufsiella ginkgonis]
MKTTRSMIAAIAFTAVSGIALAQNPPAKETKSTRDTIRTAAPAPVRRDTVARKETRSTRDTIKTSAPPTPRDTTRRDTTRKPVPGKN